MSRQSATAVASDDERQALLARFAADMRAVQRERVLAQFNAITQQYRAQVPAAAQAFGHMAAVYADLILPAVQRLHRFMVRIGLVLAEPPPRPPLLHRRSARRWRRR